MFLELEKTYRYLKKKSVYFGGRIDKFEIRNAYASENIPRNLREIAYIHNPSMCETETGRSKVQGHG